MFDNSTRMQPTILKSTTSQSEGNEDPSKVENQFNHLVPLLTSG